MNYEKIVALKNFVIYTKEEKKTEVSSFVTTNDPIYKNVVVSVGDDVIGVSPGDEIIVGRYGEVALPNIQKLYAIKVDDVVGINK